MLRRLAAVALATTMTLALLPQGAHGTAPRPCEEWGESDLTAHPPKDLRATPGDGHILLEWHNRGDGYTGTLVLRSHVGYAGGPLDREAQDLLMDEPCDELVDEGLTNGVDYYYTLFNRDPLGGWSDPATVSAFPGIPTGICAWADRDVASFEGNVTIWGELYKAVPEGDGEWGDGGDEPGVEEPGVDEPGGELSGVEESEGESNECDPEEPDEGEPIPGRDDVTVWRSFDHGKTWSQDGTATWDAAEGLYAAVRTVTVNTKFQLRFAGDKTGPEVLAPSRSGWIYVPCRAGLKRPYNAKVVRKHKVFRVTGKYLHRPAGRVRLAFYRKVRGQWVRYREPYAANAAGNRYTLRYRLPAKGVWYVKGYYRDARHAPTTTSKRFFYVR